MPDLSTDFCGIKAPNPFWLAAGPPTNSESQVRRAFEAGWGGAVWKTLTNEPTVNVFSRYGAIDYGHGTVMGLNNIELISDRPLQDNLNEMARVKREFPDRALIASLMVESTREAWHEITKQAQDAGADAVELNFGCPHGMSERGMGSAVGQVPEYTTMTTEWVKEVATVPVIVKLTPNVTDIGVIGRAAVEGGADGLSLINTLNSIMGVDLESLAPKPSVRGQGSHGGYCGPAVKPIALNMLASLAQDPGVSVPLSGIGGIQSWQDAAEFMLLGAGSVQVCTAVMHHGFAIIKPMFKGLEHWMKGKGFGRLEDFIGRTIPAIRPWGELDLNYKVTARIDQEACIHCGICHVSCEDGCYQAIFEEPRKAAGHTHNYYVINEDACVGCNMCSLICPVEDCIRMEEVDTGRPPLSWNQYQRLLAEGRVEKIRFPQEVYKQGMPTPLGSDKKEDDP